MTNHAHRLDRLERLADRLDTAIRIPVVGVRLGYDSIVGLIPGVGDVLTLLPTGYIIYESHRMGASRPVIAKMSVNAAIDAAIGSIPILGDLFDVAFKANKRNVAILRQHLFERGLVDAAPPRHRTA